MKKSKYPGVYTDGRNYYTLSSDSKSVYGERVIKKGSQYFHLWNPYRSKLSAAMHLKLKNFPFSKKTILYLGASTGTTVSHLSDISDKIWAVEISPISMKKLLSLAERRENIIPILEDARKCENYSLFVRNPDIIYQDISQRDQVEIFMKNMEHFSVRIGFLMLKTRTIDMRSSPKEVMKRSRRKIEEKYKIKETINISKFQKDHYAFVVVR